jgi:hypothetical protein
MSRMNCQMIQVNCAEDSYREHRRLHPKRKRPNRDVKSRRWPLRRLRLIPRRAHQTSRLSGSQSDICNARDRLDLWGKVASLSIGHPLRYIPPNFIAPKF